jgi:peptidyl-prolyl cis-trans isomerase C
VKRSRWTVLLPVALAVLAGCSPGSRELARVGSSVITRDDFEAAARMNGAVYAQLGDSARYVLLDDLVKRLLLVESAKQQGLFRDSLFLEYTKTVREQVLRNALIGELTGGEVKVSEGEARAYYERQGVEGKCRVVYVQNRAMAEAARAELDRGTDFALVAARFNSGGQLPPGGDIGWVKGGSLVRALDEWLVSGPLNQVVGPVEQPGLGWFLMKVEERRKAALPAYDEVRGTIVSTLAQRKRGGALQRRAAWMMQAEGVTVEPGAPQLLMERLRTAGDQMRMDPMQRRPQLVQSDAERAQVLARWNGGTLTLGEAATAIDRGADPPNTMMLPMVERWIQDQCLQRIVVQEAERRRLADEPEHAREIRERQNQYLIEALYSKQVAEVVSVSDDELRAMHQAQAATASGSRLQSADLVLTMIPDSAAALRVVDHGAHSGTLQQALRMAGVEVPVGPLNVTFPSDQPLWQQLEPRIEAMQPGEISGPFSTPMGWLVIQLARATRGSTSFEDMPPAILEQMRMTMVERKREVRFQVVADSLRRVIPVTIDREALAKTPWPAASEVRSAGVVGG